MPSLLVILLTISLVVVGAGLLLSYKPSMRSQRITPARVRQQVVVVDSLPPRDRSVVPSKQLIVPFSSMEFEPYARDSVAIPVIIDHIFEPGQGARHVPWMRMIAGLAVILIIGLFTLNMLFPRHTDWNLIMWYNGPYSSTQSSSQSNLFSTRSNASTNLVRLSQLDPTQYVSNKEFTTWAYSACSTTSLTEVLNAYGRHLRITDVLKVEANLGEITPQLGLLYEAGIQKTAAEFGFKTIWGHNLSLAQIIAIANQGRPVIVSFPPDRYAGGHLLVVTGGNSSIVKLADSSAWDRQSLSRAQFLHWWEGFYAIVTPK